MTTPGAGQVSYEGGGKLAANVLHFGRFLRAAGMPVGTGQILDAVRAVARVGVKRRRDVHWALHAVFVTRRDQRELFEQAFDLFWRDPFGMNKALALLSPRAGVEDPTPDDTLRRLKEAWSKPREQPRREGLQREEEEEDRIDAVMTYSNVEVLRAKDFEQMTSDELRRARQVIAGMRLPIRDRPTRRFRPDHRGSRIDPRRSLRASVANPHAIELHHRSRQVRPPPLVVLCDISGSMERYSRIFLHFLHALTNARDRVHSFVFGTRLTNVTRALRYRDIDLALARVGQEVLDWSGGTRIGECLQTFNKHWGRRVLGQGAVVLLVTDGLDRDPSVDLGFEADRLRRSCRRLIWLNPLLRYEGFEPRARGVEALLAHVHEFRPVHNLESLQQLAEVLGGWVSRPASRP